MLVVALSVNVIGVQVYAEENQTAEDIGWDGITKENVYETDNFRVTFALTSSWETGYNAKVRIENLGEETIQNWGISFKSNN